MTNTSGARAAAHAQVRTRILEVAREQMHTTGAAQLSMRAVIAEVGMVSSAIYRYFPSRDDLISALIAQSYQALADTLADQEARGRRRAPRSQFIGLAKRFIEWATDNPEDFALLYGTPIPGFRAANETIEPAARVAAPFFEVVAQASLQPEPVKRVLSAQARAVAQVLDVDLPEHAVVGTFLALAHLVGVMTLRLGGHFVGTFDPADALADQACEVAADMAGL